MTATRHEHAFVWDGEKLLPCVCGADVMAVESALHPAADDARGLAGDAYYTGCRLRQELEAVELWLFKAPEQVVEQLEAKHPGVYLIHNDAPRPLSAPRGPQGLVRLGCMESRGSQSLGRRSHGGRLPERGVEDDLGTAQKKLDAAYGGNVVRVSQQGPIVALHA